MEQRHLICLAGTLALAFLLALPAAAADPGRIAFAGQLSDHWDIYVMDSDGSGVTKLTWEGIEDIDPAWSPDGSRIAFASESTGSDGYNIFTMKADGTEVVRLTYTAPDDFSPAWSPDGARIAFASNDDIWVMNADGSSAACLTGASGAVEIDPTWSPDGSRIAYTNYSSQAQIWVMNADGTGRSRLTFGPPGYKPSWSPDGTRIAYGAYDWDGIHVMNADGSGDMAISGGQSGDWNPCWSPDGTRIAFQLGGDLLAMDPDGSNRATFSYWNGVRSDPAWGVAYPPAPPLVPVSPSPLLPTDTDGDGVNDDVNGNGRADFADVVLYFNQMSWIAANEPIGAFDCNGNGRIDFADVVWLFNGL